MRCGMPPDMNASASFARWRGRLIGSMGLHRTGTGRRAPGVREVSAAMIVSILIALSVYHPYPYDNVVTRWALAERLASSGSIAIDPYADLTSDKAEHAGRFYSDKSFLPSAAAAFAYLPFEALGLSADADSYPFGGAPRYIAERLTVSLALLGVLLLLKRRCAREDVDPVIPVLAAGLGSIMLPYSTLLYTHVPAAMLIFTSWTAQEEERWLASDILGALAVAWEYTLLLPYLVLLLYRGRLFWRPGPMARSIGILALALLPQMAHNWAAFGSPFTMGYAMEVEEAFAVSSRGFFGFTYPSPQRLYALLLSPERGLLFYMPWAALGLWGLLQGSNLRERLSRDPLPALAAVYIMLYASQNAVAAGWAFGQRYLIAILPFLAVGLGRFAGRSRVRAMAASTAVLPGMLQALLGTFGEVHLPTHTPFLPVPLPQVNISLRMLLDGHHSIWLGGTVITVLLASCALALWAFSLRRGRFRSAALLWLPPWLLLAALSAGRDWGGKVDYYRGVLAEHRAEWHLAAEYYGAALEDPTAPDVVRVSYRRALRRAAGQ